MKRFAALAAILALLLAGCVRIPSNGPVTAAEVDNIEDRSGIEFIANSPAEGASPEAIILGFLAAGVSPGDDYEVAREYLTRAASASWDPTADVLVRSGQPQISMTSETSGEIAVNIINRIDSNGVMQRVEESTQILTFELSQVDGEWRLSEVPRGVLLSSYMFEQLFRGVPVQWYTTDGEYFVPDLRWFLNSGATIARDIVGALVEGPAPWLQGSVLPSAASDATLVGEIAERPGGISVTISTARPGSVTEQELSRFALQIQRSLVATSGTVEVRVEGADDVIGLSTEAQAPSSDLLWSDPLLFGDGEVSFARSNGPIIPSIGEQLAELGAESFALVPGLDNARVGAAHAMGDVYWVDGDDSVQIGEQTATAPSVDRFSTVWWVDNAEEQRVHAWSGGDNVSYSLDLAGERVSSIAVSPEGARLAVVTASNGNTTIRLFAIGRSGVTPEGLTLGSELATPGGRATDVVWSDFGTLMIVSDEDGSTVVRQFELDGSSQTFNPITGTITQVAPPASGGSSIIALTEEGTVYSMMRYTNSRIAVSDIEFLIY